MKVSQMFIPSKMNKLGYHPIMQYYVIMEKTAIIAWNKIHKYHKDNFEQGSQILKPMH